MIILQWINSQWTAKLSDDLLKCPVRCPVETSHGDKCDFTTTVPLDEHGFLSLCLSGGSVTKSDPPSAHIPLLSRMTGLIFTANAFILAMKYQIVIYDPIPRLSGFVLLSGCLQKLHQFLLWCIHMQFYSQTGMSSDLKFDQDIRLQPKYIKSQLVWS